MSVTRRNGEELIRRSLRSRCDSEEAVESGSGSGKLTLDTDAEDSLDGRPELADALRIHDELVAYVHSLSGHVKTKIVVKGQNYEDAELKELLEEDSSQTQKELALTLEVTQQAVSHRLESLGMKSGYTMIIQKEEYHRDYLATRQRPQQN
ncbi:Mariner Mos1 transposase [Eumeta japonica]|uniref:Mariner Mos1 transposase n=1 Tax=Eumeta variegata TaxID=151549 RepID=A0A4C1T9I8_EUMVA|nr:Mariner Mos1 transposase [Eumeta japonica]